MDYTVSHCLVVYVNQETVNTMTEKGSHKVPLVDNTHQFPGSAVKTFVMVLYKAVLVSHPNNIERYVF